MYLYGQTNNSRMLIMEQRTVSWKQIIYNNNNNKDFKSQTSCGRLELKPSRSNQGSSMWIAVFQALLSKAKSLGIFHPFKSPFIASTQVNFGLPLPLFTLLSWLRVHLVAAWNLTFPTLFPAKVIIWAT